MRSYLPVLSAIVVLGAVTAPLIGWLAGFDAAAVLGVFSGASTNTPSLGAGSQTLAMQPDIDPDRLALPALPSLSGGLLLLLRPART